MGTSQSIAEALPACARCAITDRHADELGFLSWTCGQCQHRFLALNPRAIEGPWGGPPLQEAGVCTNCAYDDDWHCHEGLTLCAASLSAPPSD